MENTSQMGRREWVISGRQGQLTSARTIAELHILVSRTALDSVLWADTHTELPGPPCRLRNVASGCGQTQGAIGWWPVASGEVLAAGGSHAIPISLSAQLVPQAPTAHRPLSVAMYLRSGEVRGIPACRHAEGTTTGISARDAGALVTAPDTWQAPPRRLTPPQSMKPR